MEEEASTASFAPSVGYWGGASCRGLGGESRSTISFSGEASLVAPLVFDTQQVLLATLYGKVSLASSSSSHELKVDMSHLLPCCGTGTGGGVAVIEPPAG